MMPRTGSARRTLGILKKVSGVESCLGRRRLALLACRSQARGLGQVSHKMGGGRWKSQNRKNVYLSPYVEEPLNSKVIKSFVPELRSRVFCVSRFLCSIYIYIYIWTLYVHFAYSCMWLCNIYNCVQTNDYWILEATQLGELFLFDRNTWYHITDCKKRLRKNTKKSKYKCSMNALSLPLSIK